MLRRISVAAVVLSIAILLPACGGDDETTTEPADTGDGGNAIDVTLREFAIGTSASEAAAGDVTFTAMNEGPEDEHEFVVIATDLAIDALPTVEDGSVDEEGEGIEVIGEIEGIPVGESDETTMSLDAGSYVLICNIVDVEDGEPESHYQEGMRTAFTVT